MGLLERMMVVEEAVAVALVVAVAVAEAEDVVVRLRHVTETGTAPIQRAYLVNFGFRC